MFSSTTNPNKSLNEEPACMTCKTTHRLKSFRSVNPCIIILHLQPQISGRQQNKNSSSHIFTRNTVNLCKSLFQGTSIIPKMNKKMLAYNLSCSIEAGPPQFGWPYRKWSFGRHFFQPARLNCDPAVDMVSRYSCGWFWYRKNDPWDHQPTQ